MTIYALNRLTLSLKRFVDIEMPKCQLTYYGKNRYYGNCQLPKHGEVEGHFFLMDEQTGRAACVGKCQFKGADITQIAALLWECTNTEAAKRLQEQASRYGPKRLKTHDKGERKKTIPTWDWSSKLQPFPEAEIASLARQKEIPELSIRRAISLGVLWHLPENRRVVDKVPDFLNRIRAILRAGDNKGVTAGRKRHYGKHIPASWVITDRKREQGMRRRMDGQPWEGKVKSKLLPGCSGKTQIGLMEALEHEGDIMVVEGGPDLLAALGYFPNREVICMPSAYTDFCPIARRALAKRKIVIIPHADEAGNKALERWLNQLGDDVEWMKFENGAKDFNEWIKVSAS